VELKSSRSHGSIIAIKASLIEAINASDGMSDALPVDKAALGKNQVVLENPRLHYEYPGAGAVRRVGGNGKPDPCRIDRRRQTGSVL